MSDEAFNAVIDTLIADQSPRVWSLIVTVFGDLAQAQGKTLSGPVLSAILSPLGVRPEAMRVALHRLRNDGWIETEKRGRESLHSLSAFGREQSASVVDQIYARSTSALPKWHVLCFPQAAASDEHQRASDLKASGYVQIAPATFLANGDLNTPPSGAFVIRGAIDDVPAWLRQSIVTPELRARFAEFCEIMQKVEITELFASQLTALQIATLRTLIVHRWRRLVLKLPNVPDVMFEAGFEGLICRKQVTGALALLKRPDISAL